MIFAKAFLQEGVITPVSDIVSLSLLFIYDTLYECGNRNAQR